MDSKMLYLSVLLGVFCLWYTEASPVEGAALDDSTQHIMDIDYRKNDHPDDEALRAQVQERSATVAAKMATKYANKAKALESEARLMNQLAKDRHYYYREYTKLAEDARRRSRDAEQLAITEGSRVGGHQQRQKEYESKAREAEAQCKETDLKAQEYFTTAQERYKNSADAYSEAAIADAQAYGYQRRAERLQEHIRELKQRAETVNNDARVHYTKGKDDENRATAEKAKAHQQAQDSQKHLSASRAYQQEAVRTRMSSRNNIMKYIQHALQGERTRNMGREEAVKSELENKVANEYVRSAEQSGAIYKVLSREYAYNAARAKHEETRSMVDSESSREVASMPGENSSLIKLAEAGNEIPDIERQHRLSIYEADDPVKAIGTEEKDPNSIAGEGL